MHYIFLDMNNMLYRYNIVLYSLGMFTIIKWLKKLRCVVYTTSITICALIEINKQTRK
jgi:hypothetical protein